MTYASILDLASVIFVTLAIVLALLYVFRLAPMPYGDVVTWLLYTCSVGFSVISRIADGVGR